MTHHSVILGFTLGFLTFVAPSLSGADTGVDDVGPNATDAGMADATSDTGDVIDTSSADTTFDVMEDTSSPTDATTDGDSALDVQEEDAGGGDVRDATAGDGGDTLGDGGPEDVRDDVARDATEDVDEVTDAADKDVKQDIDLPPLPSNDAGEGASDRDTGSPSDAEGIDGGDTAMQARFAGQIELQSRADGEGVTVTLQRPLEEGQETVGTQTTDAEGRFVFEELALARYQVQIEKEGFVMVGETFELDGDRDANYRLFRDQSVDFRVRAIFPENAEVPSDVNFELEGPRGTFTPDEPVAVEEEAAVWERQQLGIGRWTIRATASNYETVNFGFNARGADEARRQLTIKLRMVPLNRRPTPVQEASGCGCSNDRSRGGGGGFRGAPGGGRLSTLLLVGLGLLAMRRRRR